MIFFKVKRELKFTKVKLCPYAAIFHNPDQCLNSLVLKKKKKNQNQNKTWGINKNVQDNHHSAGCINIYYLVSV